MLSSAISEPISLSAPLHRPVAHHSRVFGDFLMARCTRITTVFGATRFYSSSSLLPSCTPQVVKGEGRRFFLSSPSSVRPSFCFFASTFTIARRTMATVASDMPLSAAESARWSALLASSSSFLSCDDPRLLLRRSSGIGFFPLPFRRGSRSGGCQDMGTVLTAARRGFHTSGSEESSVVDHYVTLGVPPNASVQEIKTAYKKLALQYHPDRNPGNAAAEERFKCVSAAYHVIGNKERRKQYDMERQFGASSAFGHGAAGAEGWGSGSPPGSPPGWASASTEGGPSSWSSAFGGRNGGSHYTYQRMSKDDADKLFREIFGTKRVQDIFSTFNQEWNTSPPGSIRSWGVGNHEPFAPKTLSSSWFQAFTTPRNPLSSSTSTLFGPGGWSHVRRKNREGSGAPYTHHAQRTVRVFVDEHGQQVEEETFNDASGMTYRTVRRHTTGGGGGMGESTTQSRWSSQTADGNSPSSGGGAGGSSSRFGGGGGGGEGPPFEGRNNGFEQGRGSGGEDPFSQFASYHSTRPPYSFYGAFMASLWFFSWVVILTSLGWMLLATLVTHPLLSLAIIFLMMAGRGRI